MTENNAPSLEKKIRTYLIALGMIGLLDSLYLSYIKITNTTASCAGIGDCDVVNSSPYSEIYGIPIALLGAGAYLLMLFLLVMESRGGVWRTRGPLVVFLFTLVGVIYSAYLTYIEIAVLHAICPYCVVSAVVLVLMLALSTYRYISFDGEDL